MEDKVSLNDIKFIVNGFESYGFSRKRAFNWCRKNKKYITSEFMEEIYQSSDAFFYNETHLRENPLFESFS